MSLVEAAIGSLFPQLWYGVGVFLVLPD